MYKHIKSWEIKKIVKKHRWQSMRSVSLHCVWKKDTKMFLVITLENSGDSD